MEEESEKLKMGGLLSAEDQEEEEVEDVEEEEEWWQETFPPTPKEALAFTPTTKEALASDQDTHMATDVGTDIDAASEDSGETDTMTVLYEPSRPEEIDGRMLMEDEPILSARAAGIQKLIDDSQIIRDLGDFETAKRKVLQGMLGAINAMEEYLATEDTDVTPQQLADWFGSCAYILNDMMVFLPAIRCFYTATVFDGDWKIENHSSVSLKMWTSVWSQDRQLLAENSDKIFDLLDKVFSTAKLAFKRRLFLLASMICLELSMVYRILIFQKNLCRTGFQLYEPEQRYRKAMKPVCVFSAHCHYQMQEFDAVKKVCGDILTKFCDYDCVEALELWALVLMKEKKYDLAEKKIRHALDYTKQSGDVNDRLIKHLQIILMKQELVVNQNVPEVDPSWLEGTAAEACKNRKPNATPPDNTKTETPRKNARKKHVPRYKENPSPNTEEPRAKKRAKREQRLKDKSVSRLVDESQRDRSRCSSECSVATVSTVASDASFYSGRWSSDQEDSDDNSQSDAASSTSNIFHTETEQEEVDEDRSFYEQSQEFFYNNDLDEKEMSDDVLLRSGLELNMSYMARFEDQHPNRLMGEPFYDEFFTKEALKEMMLKQPNIFIRCKVQIEGSHLSYCTPLDSNINIETVEISGRSKAGQVFNEDEVVVQLLDLEHAQENKRYGKIIGVWERKRYKGIKHPVFICTLDVMETHLVRPMCRTVPKINILNDEIMKTCRKMKRHKIEVYTYDHSCGELTDPKIHDVNPGDLNKYVFLVAMINWRRQTIYPKGAIIRVLPYGESLNRGFMLLSLKHEVPTLYQKSVLDRTESITRRCGDEIDPVHLEGRVDLTDKTVFTIDPPGSRDLDDALSVEKVDGGYKVGVHIADVSHFVMKGDPVDLEAKQRTTTFYTGIYGKMPRNMLPEPFSTKLCSLLPNKTRLTLSVFFLLSPNGKLMQMLGPSVEFAKTFIRSCQQFTYRQVQDIIVDKEEHTLKDDVKCLYKLATAIRKERLKDSMFALEISNEEDLLEDDVGETLEAHFLVEEFMIMANRAVANRLVRTYPDCIPLRCQPHPNKESMIAFIKKNDPYIDTLVKLQGKHICDYKTPTLDSLLGTSGQQYEAFSVIVPRHLWDILSSAGSDCSKLLRTDDLYPLQHLVHQHWLAIQERAEYKCSSKGKDNSATLNHFSLEMYPYTHFTSPIRRYIDLVIHRLLHASLERAPHNESPYNKSEIEDICSTVNSRAKHAKDFQRECKMLKEAIDLKRKSKMVACYIDEVSDRSLTLRSPDLKHVSKLHKELSFSLLDVGRKPEMGEDPLTSQEFVKTTWRKRIYDTKVSSLTPYNHVPDEGKTLNPSMGTVSVPLQKWARLVKCSVEGRFADMKKAIGNTTAMVSERGSEDVSTESLDPTKMQPFSIFSMSFKHGQTVKVQMAAMPWRGLLAPKPVLYSMTNNVKLCLQHTDDPVLTLSHYSTKATCSQYTSVKMLLDRWLPLLEMEAAICAVTNEESCLINNVPIKFENSIEGKIAFPLGFCEVRNIEFSGTSSEFEFDEYFEEGGQSFDWLCLRRLLAEPENTNNKVKVTPSLSSVWMGHAKVTSVTKRKATKDSDDGKIIVKFQLHKSPPLTDETMGTNNRYCVEILRKSEVDRRTESYMKQLKGMEGTLAHTIALNKGAIPKLDQEHIEMAAGIERDLYIPQTEDVRPLPRNNERQQEAIDKALKNRFTLIQGPPGTGKTYTGIKLLYLFDKVNRMISQEGGKRHQVLFCGPSNKSVDLVAKWMLKRLGSLRPKFIRVYGRSIEAIDYPIPGRTFLSKRSTRDLKANPELSSVTLHHLIRQKGKKFAEEINALDRMFRDSDYAPQHPDVIKEYVHLVREATIDEVRQHDVILCTTAVGSNPKILKAGSVFQVIIDEAGMCTEPQCLVPIIATRAEQVVLIGDHKQLRPIIKSKQAAELGLDQSMFERYAESDTAKNVQFTMLDIQYRMNPQLCRFPSKMFYEGKLTTESGLWMRDTINIWPASMGKPYPHVLIPVEGEEKSLTVSTEEGNEHSRSNMEEAELVVKLFRYLVDEGIQTNDINLISQYNAQCAHLRDRLKTEGFVNVNVTTVVSSQGGEWDYVIFSTVRSLPDYKIEKRPTLGWCKQNLGFITDEHQINVALTRARKGLIIVGNPKLLKCDRVWGRLISHYDKTDCILSPEEFPPPHRTRLARRLDAQLRSEARYGDDRFTPGVATSYEGDFDNIDDSDDEDERGGFQHVRRGGRGRGRGRANNRR